jgi:hypothetical protein
MASNQLKCSNHKDLRTSRKFLLDILTSKKTLNKMDAQTKTSINWYKIMSKNDKISKALDAVNQEYKNKGRSISSVEYWKSFFNMGGKIEDERTLDGANQAYLEPDRDRDIDRDRNRDEWARNGW